jgi:hypothetical protein
MLPAWCKQVQSVLIFTAIFLSASRSDAQVSIDDGKTGTQTSQEVVGPKVQPAEPADPLLQQSRSLVEK